MKNFKSSLNQKLSQIGGDKMCPIAIILRDNCILVGLRNYTKSNTKHDFKEISVWTNPGGRCDVGETIGEALRREVKEEVGITKFEIVDFIDEVPGAKEGDVVPMFFCTTNEDARLMEPEKFSKWSWVPILEYLSGSNYNGFNPVARKTIEDYLRNLSQ